MTQLKSNRTRRSEIFRDHVNQVLKNRGDGGDDQWWEEPEAREELERLACGGQDYVSNSDKLKIESGEKLILAVYRNDKNALFQEITVQAGDMARNSDTEIIHILFFVQDMRDRIQLEQIFSRNIRALIRAKIKEQTGRGNFPLQDTYILDREYKKQEVRLKAIRRYEMIRMPPITSRINIEAADRGRDLEANGETLRGLVFSVDLIQLVELYNLMGDQLFKNNVRFGINEMLGVDQAICKTLKEEPEYFWYKNNGITILVQNRDFTLRSQETLLLDKLEPGKEPSISVINGAQTITASTRYYFDLESQRENAENMAEKDRLGKDLENFKKACVLVRVIYIPSVETPALGNMAKEISVALNRQKPIKIEDIAFTIPFVEKLTAYLEREKKTGRADFILARRGEGTSQNSQLELVAFARAQKACAGEPGEARSQSANDLLKYQIDKKGVYSFQQKDIFADQWMKADESQEKQVFQQLYGAVWFAQEIAQAYDTEKRQAERQAGAKEQETLLVIRNGKWYFTAALVQLLNGFFGTVGETGREIPDFSDFCASPEKVEGQLSAGILCFARMTVLYAGMYRDKYGELDSNLFKKSDCYKGLIKELERVYRADGGGLAESGNEDVWKMNAMERLMREFVTIFSEALPQEKKQKADAGTAAVGTSRDITQNGVVLDGKESFGISMADVIGKTAEFILKKYPEVWDKMGENERSWITENKNQADADAGYFRGTPRQIYTDKGPCWVGTSSNTERKIKQIRGLCQLAHVAEGEIIWYCKGVYDPVFSW